MDYYSTVGAPEHRSLAEALGPQPSLASGGPLTATDFKPHFSVYFTHHLVSRTHLFDLHATPAQVSEASITLLLEERVSGLQVYHNFINISSS